MLILVVHVAYHVFMKLSPTGSYRHFLEEMIFEKSPSLRDYCNKNKDLISHATLSRVFKKYKNGKYVADIHLSDEKFFKILKAKKIPTDDIFFLYLLKKQEELKSVLPSSHPVVHSFEGLFEPTSANDSSRPTEEKKSEVVDACLGILPEKLKKSVYVELLKKLDYYQQGSSLQARFKNILPLRQKLQSKIKSI